MSLKRPIRYTIVTLLLFGLVGTSVSVTLGYKDLPSVEGLEDCLTAEMNQVSLCPRDPSYTPLPQISQNMIHAVIVAEDASFWSHQGIDWYELKESFLLNLERGGFVRGGSTISQQLIKNVFLNPEKSLVRKFRELILTSRLESQYSKEFILEKYLNVVEFGSDLYGISDAARFYFFKSPDQLSILESTYLAHLLPNPKAYSQTFEKNELTPYSRRMIRLLLQRMLHFQYISQDQFRFAEENLDRFPWYGVMDIQ